MELPGSLHFTAQLILPASQGTVDVGCPCPPQPIKSSSPHILISLLPTLNRSSCEIDCYPHHGVQRDIARAEARVGLQSEEFSH